jgi:hypothetical protein
MFARLKLDSAGVFIPGSADCELAAFGRWSNAPDKKG